MRSAASLGAAVCGLGVITGAFGAHALEARLTVDALGWWETAVQYHFVHGLGLLAAGVASRQVGGPWPARAAWGFLLGLLLFCGSLYAMALGGPRALGMITPIGGVAWILAWGCLALGYTHRTGAVDEQGE
ncbi:MAG: DUF423 domain-containing protein [Pseudomonadota bacterium]